MILQAAVLSVLLCSAHAFSIQDLPSQKDPETEASLEKTVEHSGNTIEDDEFSVSTLLEKANANLDPNDPLVMFGDIVMPTGLGNADPCTARSCLWPKATDGNVYVPYRISNQYSQRERDTIIRGLRSFADSTCIRFTPTNNRQRDFVDIQSRSGCFSSVGRRGGGQVVSLSRQGCVFRQIIQHELLHALGFNHEQTRSDRDSHVRILLQNVIPNTRFNFRRLNTRNLGTPYDYNSVMHYGRFAFSSNRQPTIVPIPNPNVAIGRATQMSPTDIRRVNILYRCRTYLSKSDLERLRRKQAISFHE